MSEALTLKATKREETGKGANRRLRLTKQIPGVFYNKEENIALALDSIAVEKVFQQAGTSQLVHLQIDGEEARPVIIREFRRHPFKSLLEHVDFYGVDMNKPVRVRVRVVPVGSSQAVKMGAKLVQYRDFIDVECLPGNIPNSIELDIATLKVNENLGVAELPVPEGVKPLFDENFAIMGIIQKSGADSGEDEGEEAAE